MSESIPLTARIVVPEQVLTQQIEEQCALLHLESERYFGLDDVGTRIWAEVTAAPSLAAALERLEAVYDVESARLRADVLSLLATLAEHGLVEIRE